MFCFVLFSNDCASENTESKGVMDLFFFVPLFCAQNRIRSRPHREFTSTQAPCPPGSNQVYIECMQQECNSKMQYKNYGVAVHFPKLVVLQ
jgi:hypothetical protein